MALTSGSTGKNKEKCDSRILVEAVVKDRGESQGEGSVDKEPAVQA